MYDVLETPVMPTTAPRTVEVPPTEADIVLRDMIASVLQGGWTKGAFDDGHGRSCTLGLLRRFTR